MNQVGEFLHQGRLPFVGREEEMEHILDFWRGTVESQRLRVLLLTAEAGAGKSRLLEESVKRISEEGGVVVHAKLYPEAANDLANLLAQSLNSGTETRTLVGSRSDQTISDVTGALRRVSRLRPTIIVLEDLHLLASEALSDLAALLGGLSDETLSLLTLARPVQLQARGLLENYLTETIEMKGISREAIQSLWSELFDTRLKEKELTILEDATFGNCLALRSALRAALQAGAIQQRGNSSAWRLGVLIPEFESIIRQSVSLVVEGLVAQLTPQVRENISRIAMLGEVFAHETAVKVINSSEGVEELMKTDLLVQAVHPVTPIPGLPSSSTVASYPTSRFPLLAFTHSLLHNYLVKESRADAQTLCTILAEELPLYSLLPFRLLRNCPIVDDLDGELLKMSIHRGFVVAQIIDRTSNWHEGYNVWRTVEYLLPFLEGRISDEEYRVRQVMTATIRLSLLRRELHSDTWLNALNDAMEMTEEMENERVAKGRLMACLHWLELYSRKDYTASLQVQEMVESVLEKYPQLKYDVSYVYYLESLASAMERADDKEMLRKVEAMSKELIEDNKLSEYVRTVAKRRLLQFSLKTFSSSEEINERRKLLELIEEEVDEEDPYYGVTKSSFLLKSGSLTEAADLAERVSKHCQDRGIWLNALLCEATRSIARAGSGEPLADLVKRGVQIIMESSGEESLKTIQTSITNHLMHVGLYRGELGVIEKMSDEIGASIHDLTPQHKGVLGIWRQNLEEASNLITKEHADNLAFNQATLNAWCFTLDQENRGDVSKLYALLEEPMIYLSDLLKINGTVRLWLMMKEFTESAEKSRMDMVAYTAVLSALNWLRKHKIAAFMPPLIELLELLERVDEVEEWRKISQDSVPLRSTSETDEVIETAIQISMLGTIRVAIPPEDFVPLRGVRIRTLLGLMVADQMMDRPLSSEEFLRLAGGDDPDPEHARKKKNMGVVRLREIMGREAILTDQETPRLNQELVNVDLLRAGKLLQDARTAFMEGALVRALPLMQEILEIIGNEVAFPTLYDDFFEAVRGDFEYRLRGRVLDIARGLLKEGDGGRAEELLRRAFLVLPGDEEIGELLQETLTLSGNRVEAERVRIAMTE